jgi:beta-ribofuranosylaminobenzene 5'-phosphate synthase
MARVRVTASARVHFGFQNLSLAHGRLYGGMGAALSAPEVVVEATPTEGVEAPDAVAGAAERAVETLSVPGARVSLVESLPRHVGLGSGTQHALATYAAVAGAHGIDPAPRATAPALGRGGRSGVGVAAFERGGFVVDAGHPTGQFTTERPADGEWTVPPVAARHELPDEWRALLVRPAVDAGRSGEEEDVSMREVVESADPDVADRIAGVVTRRLLPAAAAGDLDDFGDALTTISRLNGVWYADEQGGVFRPPVGSVVDALDDSGAVVGAGQSSWGPTAFGLTESTMAEAARAAGEAALDAAGVDGTVSVVEFADDGARIEPAPGHTA